MGVEGVWEDGLEAFGYFSLYTVVKPNILLPKVSIVKAQSA